MKVSLKAIEVLQQRLKNLDSSVSSQDLLTLSNAVASISKLETTEDILNLSNEKLKELLEKANDDIQNLENYAQTCRNELTIRKEANLTALENARNDALVNLEGQHSGYDSELNSIVDNFSFMNDVPENSTITSEIARGLDPYKFQQNSNLPILFGILCRYDDYYGVGKFTSALGKWNSDGAETMFEILIGAHSYLTENTAFYLPPRMYFLQGKQGNFNFVKSYAKYQNSTSQYTYPYAALGCLFIKNITDEAIVSTLNLGGSSYSGDYGGASVFVGTPNYETETITWQNTYSYSGASSGFSANTSITIPANTTVCILIYTSSYYIASPKTSSSSSSTSLNYFASFIHWRLDSVRSGFLKEGLEIDQDMTLKAWQCPGFSTPFEIFR